MHSEKVVGEGNIQLIKFDKLDETEIAKIKTLMIPKVKKLGNFDLLRLNLKIHKHSTEFIHEIEGELFSEGHNPLSALAADKNIYTALTSIMDKLISEAEHSNKLYDKTKRIRENKKFQNIK